MLNLGENSKTKPNHNLRQFFGTEAVDGLF